MADKLIKIDKNGTKYYASTACRRCGGAGGAEQWALTGYTCYRCGGSGIDPHPQVYKEYTEEYAQKLEARRRKAQEKKDAERRAKAKELNKRFYEMNNFSEDGKTYVALGDAYGMREDLKKNGFRFNRFIGWMSPVEVDGVKTIELSADDLFCSDNCGVFDYMCPKRAYFYDGKQIDENEANEFADCVGFSWEWNGLWLVQQANKEIEGELETEYVGEVGKKISVEVTLKHTAEWESTFGYRTRTNYLYIMEDKNGNKLTWKTQSILCYEVFDNKGDTYYRSIDEDRPFIITGKVKEHRLYDGVKETVLERCKVEQCCICTE